MEKCFGLNLTSLETDHFIDVCSVIWPLNGSEAGGDLVLIQTSMLLLCKSSCSYANYVHLHETSREVCIKARSPLASLAVIDQVTKQTTVKWPTVKYLWKIVCGSPTRDSEDSTDSKRLFRDLSELNSTRVGHRAVRKFMSMISPDFYHRDWSAMLNETRVSWPRWNAASN